MAIADFLSQAKQLGYAAELANNNQVSFPYTIEVGRLAGQAIRLGFIAPDDFPLNPPSGPHVSPHLLPINRTQEPHPKGGVHDNSPFGAEWQYWSRPFNGWNTTDHTVRTYMSHIRLLFDTL